jgi:hypothetical protein
VVMPVAMAAPRDAVPRISSTDISLDSHVGGVAVDSRGSAEAHRRVVGGSIGIDDALVEQIFSVSNIRKLGQAR